MLEDVFNFNFFTVNPSLTPPRTPTGSSSSNLDHAMAATLANIPSKSTGILETFSKIRILFLMFINDDTFDFL